MKDQVNSWEVEFDRLNMLDYQKGGWSIPFEGSDMYRVKKWFTNLLSSHRQSLIREINQLKIDTPPYPMEGPNAEMITWAARKGYIDALNEVLSRLDK